MTRRARLWLAAAAAAGLAALGVPYLGAGRFSATIRDHLEASLGRQVDINGGVRFRILPWPGFSASDVVIHELSDYGVEPIAYVTTLEAAARLSGLVRGRLDLSGIRLVEPSINLTRSASAGWNFAPLLNHSLGEAASGSRLPSIEVDSARINVKFGELKSTLYLAGTSLTVESSSSNPGRISIRFSGEPALTNRGSSAFGTLSGRGWIEPGAPGGGRGDLSLAIQRTAIAELMGLLQETPSGLGGFLTSRARLTGPLHAMNIEATIELSEIERWSWLSSGAPRWSLDLHGALDLPNRSFRLQTRQPASGARPVSVDLQASELLTHPRWSAVLSLLELPFATVRSFAAETGAAFPTRLPLEGNLSGTLRYSSAGNLQGALRLSGGSLAVSASASYPLDEAELEVEGARYRVASAGLRLDDGQLVSVEVRHNQAGPSTEVRLEIPQMDIDAFRSAWQRVSSAPAPAPLLTCKGGTFGGNLRYIKSGQREGTWTGRAKITQSECRLDGFALPLKLETADLALRGAGFDVPHWKGATGDLALAGSLIHDAGAGTPDRLRLQLEETGLAAIEKLLAPALRRPQGLLARTLGRTPPPPAWLRSRSAEVEFEIGTLHAAGPPLQRVQGRIVWEGATVELRDIEATAPPGGLLRAAARVNLEQAEPRYSAQFQLDRYPWHEGRLDADGRLRAEGTGPDLLRSLWIDGSFSARGVEFTPATGWTSGSGCFLFHAAADGPKLLLTALSASLDAEDFAGQGAAGADGRLAVELSSATRQLRLAGRLDGSQLELVAPRPAGR